MPISKEQKKEYVLNYGQSETNTGSTKVQIALLTHRINELTEHLRSHVKDHHTRLGLMRMVGKRRRLLNYIEREDIASYRNLLKDLSLRK